MKTQQIRDMLEKFQKEMTRHGLEFFCVAAMPNTNEGASIYNGRNLPDGAATNARNAHMKWEKIRGINTEHDWGKEKTAFHDW